MKPRKFIPILLAAMLAVSCTCQQRIERLQRHCPECFATATVQDTVRIDAVHIDTVLRLSPRPDGTQQADIPIVIDHRQGLLHIDICDTTAAVSLHLPPDTVVVQRTVRLPAKQPQPYLRWYEILIMAAVLVLQMITLFSNRNDSRYHHAQP